MTLYNLHDQKQFGFRADNSYEAAFTLMVDTWLSALNKGNRIGLLLIDLCKAFDLVDHDLLSKKLKIYKCNPSSLQWFKSYLSSREQLVEINSTKSDSLQIKSGLAQGSILGPLLFIVFINDISLEEHLSDINLFADDAVAREENKSKDDIINKCQKCASSLDSWCISNKMVLSIQKTKKLFISNSQKKI